MCKHAKYQSNSTNEKRQQKENRKKSKNNKTKQNKKCKQKIKPIKEIINQQMKRVMLRVLIK